MSQSRKFIPFNISAMQPQPFLPRRQAPKCWGWFQLSLQRNPTCFKGFIPHKRTLVGSVAHLWFYPLEYPSEELWVPCSMLFPSSQERKKVKEIQVHFYSQMSPKCGTEGTNRVCAPPHNLYWSLPLVQYLENTARFKNQTWSKYGLHPPTCQLLMHSWTWVKNKMFWCCACTLSLTCCSLLSSWMFGKNSAGFGWTEGAHRVTWDLQVLFCHTGLLGGLRRSHYPQHSTSYRI